MIQEQLNAFLLNEVVNGVLFLVLVVLYINTLLDRRIHATKRDRDFSLFVLFSALYIGLMLIWLPLRHFGSREEIDFAVSALRVLAAVLTYGFCASWILSVAEVKKLTQPRLRSIVMVIMVVFFILSMILRILTRSALIANIPIFLYYLLLVVLALVYRKSIGTTYTAMIVALIVVESLLQIQTWWNYTPANVFLVLGMMLIYSRAWLAEKEQRIESERIVAEQKAELENARTKLVLSQIKPHFLFNTLSTIAYLCTKQPKMAQELCIDLTSYLRGNLSALDSGKLVRLEDELEHVRTYLKIEQVRFGDKLAVVYDVQDTDFKLPALTIEPLAENAVKHGIRKSSKGGKVVIATREENDCHVALVQDDGAGFNVDEFDENKGDHVGLRSVRRRVELLSNGTLTMESREGFGTTAILRIPK